MNMDDALQTFLVESRDLLQQMEEALLTLEHSPQDTEMINALFRAAHTIKGSAGLFGLDFIVSFTHVAESVLDRVRDQSIPFDDKLGALLLEVGDHIGTLVELVATGSGPDETVQAISEALQIRLKAYLGDTAPHVTPSPLPAEPKVDVERSGGGEVSSDQWHISLRFNADVLRNGMDPLAFLRYLGSLGRVAALETIHTSIPELDQMDAETCYLGFEIGFVSDADKATIDGAFDFVREGSHIRILPPHSRIEEYLVLIADDASGELPLGEILVRCGSLTRAELVTALALQANRETTPREPIGQVLVEESLVHAPVVEAALDKQKQTKDARSNDAGLIRVEAAKLDQLINLVGELIIAGAGTSLVAQRKGIPELVEATGTLSRLVEQVRDSALNLRMVQIGATFNRFRRVVRDVSKELGKDIELAIHGGETELDKTVVEKIGDPLTHIVRNSMDHGIESAELRLSRGKPAQGTVKLNAFHESGSIVIEVSDDGGGLSKQRILKKAIERGLIAEGQALADKEIFNLVFEPGFSTAEQVSNLSGRGVGMDVVRRNIQALRGTVDLESVEGQGTTVRIRLPLTLAIIDGFLVGVGSSAYVVPLDMVEECIELPREEVSASGSNYLNLRGEVLPFVRLRELFEVEGEPLKRENVVVVKYAGERAGLVVDQLMGEFQTVIKPLGKVFSQIRSIGGSTILGSGEVALILDVPGLVKQVKGTKSQPIPVLAAPTAA